MFIKITHWSERKAVREVASLRYINPAAIFKTIRINVIIYRFSHVDKATRKRKKNLNTLGTNSRGCTFI